MFKISKIKILINTYQSFRNEMVKANDASQRVLLATAGIPQQAQTMILENKE